MKRDAARGSARKWQTGLLPALMPLLLTSCVSERNPRHLIKVLQENGKPSTVELLAYDRAREWAIVRTTRREGDQEISTYRPWQYEVVDGRQRWSSGCPCAPVSKEDDEQLREKAGDDETLKPSLKVYRTVYRVQTTSTGDRVETNSATVFADNRQTGYYVALEYSRGRSGEWERGSADRRVGSVRLSDCRESRIPFEDAGSAATGFHAADDKRRQADSARGSADAIRFISAGPDKTFGTADDLTRTWKIGEK